MIEFPLGLSLTETEDGFLLVRKAENGELTRLYLSEPEMIGLKAKCDAWAAQFLQRAQAKSGSVQAIVAHPVSEVAATIDAFSENALLQMRAPTGEQMTLSLSLGATEALLAELPGLLARMKTAPTSN